MYICIDKFGEMALGETIEAAYEKFMAEDGLVGTEIENLTFHELGKPIKARFSLTIDGSL
jgi:hypothetical protein